MTRRCACPPDEQHHLLDVLRAKPGDTVCRLRRPRAGGRGAACGARRGGRAARDGAAEAGRGPCCRCCAPRRQRPAVGITLIQALPKGRGWTDRREGDGAGRRADLARGHGARRGSARRGQRGERRERWQRIARSAAKQCGTAWIPDILPVSDFGESWRRAATFRPFRRRRAGGRRAGLCARSRTSGRRAAGCRAARLLIGPEGDLTPEELRVRRAAGGGAREFRAARAAGGDGGAVRAQRAGVRFAERLGAARPPGRPRRLRAGAISRLRIGTKRSSL